MLALQTFRIYVTGFFMKLKVITENKTSENSRLKLAKNLCCLLTNYNLNANKLAQILGIPMMTIRRLLSGETTDPRISTIKLVANYFDVSVDSLIEENHATSIQRTKPQMVPKLDWEIIEKISTIHDIDFSKWKEWQSASLGENDILSNHAFALESRPSMYPRFPQGTIFIFDPDITPKDGDLVLIKLKKNNELTLRELAIDPPEWKLHSVVSGSIMLPFSKKNHEIMGVNLLTLLYSRRITNKNN